MTRVVMTELSRRDELDRPGLNLEEGGKKTGILAVEVDADLLCRSHRYALAVHELDLRVVLVHVRAAADRANATNRLGLAGVADEDHVEDALGRRSCWRHTHAAAEVLAVGDDDLLRLEVMGDAVDDHVHRFVRPGQQGHEGRHRQPPPAESLASFVYPVPP